MTTDSEKSLKTYKPIMAESSIVTEFTGWKVVDLNRYIHVFTIRKDNETRQIRIGIKGSGPDAQLEREEMTERVSKLLGETVNLVTEEWGWQTNTRSGVFYYLMSIEKVTNADL